MFKSGAFANSLPLMSSLRSYLASSAPKKCCWARTLSKYTKDDVISVSKYPKLASRVRESVNRAVNSNSIPSTSDSGIFTTPPLKTSGSVPCNWRFS